MFDAELIGTYFIVGMFIISLLNVNEMVMEDNTINGLNVIAQESVVDIANMLLTELGRIGRGVSDTAILSMGNSAITFLLDLDQDGTVDTLEYRLGAASETSQTENPQDCYLYRTVNGVSQAVALGLTSLSFIYYDLSGVPTTDPTAVRSIEISLTFQTPYYFAGHVGNARWQGRVFPKSLQLG